MWNLAADELLNHLKGGSCGFFGEGYLPSLSINYVGTSMGKRLPQLYYRKMKISCDLGFIQSESPWQRNDAITFFIFIFVSLYQEFF